MYIFVFRLTSMTFSAVGTGAYEHGEEMFGCHKSMGFLDQLYNFQLL